MTARPQASAALTAWTALNDRQQAYLLAIYAADQSAEADIADRRKQRQRTPPAAQWRWLLYTGVAGDTGIQEVLRGQGQLDPGAGSSLKALRTRGLIEVRDNVLATGLGPVEVVEVKMTTAGRAAARAGRGETPARRPPSGLLSAWLFTTLATLYRAGQDGTLYGDGNLELPRDHPERGPSWNALLQLRDRKDGSFIEEFSIPKTLTLPPGRPAPSPWPQEYRVRATPRARAHYELHYHCYRELYPDVDAVPPTTTVPDAHTGLTDHQGRRPRGLVRAPDWRLLTTLARLEQNHHSYWRERLAQDYIQYGRPVPAEIQAIPDGLDPNAARHAAGSTTALDRLRDAGLVEILELPDPGRWAQPGARITLARLTTAGHGHITTHTADYQRLYPEITNPAAP